MCHAVSTSKNRSGLRVIKQLDGNPKINLPKVLVTSIYGHEDLLDYLSDYRTQDKFKGKHYYPYGALCWFETNRYGDPIGKVYYAKKIPDMKYLDIPRRQRGFRRMLNRQKQKKKINELLAKEKPDTEQWTYAKPKLNMK